jgi:hypothetical protein
MDYSNHIFRLEDVNNCSGTDILEFGVYSGDSLLNILNKCRKINLKPRKVFGFDCFTGLTLESSDLIVYEDWKNGSFDARELFKTNSIKEIVKKLEKKLNKVIWMFVWSSANLKILINQS